MKTRKKRYLGPGKAKGFRFKGWLAADTCAKKREDWLVRTQQPISR